ncbi:MAG: glucuronate isomerase [Planctomycetota bacterium]|jgi:glucuronate isomerase
MTLTQTLFEALDAVPLVDPHSHINPRSASSDTIADLLGYHYYTELAHSAGMPRSRIEEPGITPHEKVARLFEYLHHINHSVQWSWFLELSNDLFGFQAESIDTSNWQKLYDLALAKMSQPSWEDEVLRISNVQRIFLTNDFDDPLNDFDTYRYVPCLRTDDLVFHLTLPQTRERLAKATGIQVGNLKDLQDAIGSLFAHFVKYQVRACAISLPPWFSPTAIAIDDASAQAAFQRLLASQSVSQSDREIVAYWVFWRLAEFCNDMHLPFDLMIGVNRKVYPEGVFQGQDLYDSRWSMIQYAELLNAFPKVKFPVSVLASVSNQELVDYAWIFPNVIANGHWWYSNTPTFIQHDLRARIDAIPRNKIIGYYSDAYKLEFILPKYKMFKRILANVLAESIVIERRLSESFAIDLGKQILRGNVDSIFFSQE